MGWRETRRQIADESLRTATARLEGGIELAELNLIGKGNKPKTSLEFVLSAFTVPSSSTRCTLTLAELG